MKKILVTGAAGFLGYHLSKRLLDLGHQVFGVDNFYTGMKSNIELLSNNSNFFFIQHDITQPLKLEIHEIYNLACPASPPHYQKDPIYTTKTSVIGSMNLLDLAKRNKAKIFHASTSEVYGDPLQHPQDESYFGNVNPIGIRACYDEGKRCAESLYFDYQRMFNLDIKIGRLFNTYGPNMDPNDGRVVSNFILQALKNKPLTVYGDGSQTRSFCYVSDLIEAIISVMNLPASFSGPYNMGNPTEFTVGQLGKEIISLTNSKSKLEFLELPEDDPKIRKPDISKISSDTGWKPIINLSEGLKSTIKYFNNAQ